MPSDHHSHMEPWGVLPFENDAALDWVWELEDEKDTILIADCFAAVVEAESDEIIEMTVAEEALAAAEVLAAMLERPLPELPGEVKMYLQKLRQKKPPGDLVDLAIEAVDRIKESSELRDRWEATESAVKWHQALVDLRTRLRGRERN